MKMKMEIVYFACTSLSISTAVSASNGRSFFSEYFFDGQKGYLATKDNEYTHWLKK